MTGETATKELAESVGCTLLRNQDRTHAVPVVEEEIRNELGRT